jgi:hypothetical protein
LVSGTDPLDQDRHRQRIQQGHSDSEGIGSTRNSAHPALTITNSRTLRASASLLAVFLEIVVNRRHTATEAGAYKAITPIAELLRWHIPRRSAA